MDYEEWEPYYLEIVRDFGFDPEKDELAGQVLLSLISLRDTLSAEELRALVRGKAVRVYGPAAPNLHGFDGLKFATDSAVKAMLSASLVPDVIFTDLDGDVGDMLKSSELGSIVVLHAHGDNVDALRKYVGSIKGRLAATVQTRPYPPLINFGGFTDGDRAVFASVSLGAVHTEITGFDFEKPVEKPGMTEEQRKIKKRKLEWARRLISMLEVKVV